MLISAPNITGYQIIEQLHDSPRTLVYRAREDSSSQLVIIKILRQEYPTFNELVQFRNQYTITRNLDIPSIIKSYSLEPYKNSYALVMEDFGGISLAELIEKRPLTVAEFLPIAIQIADTLRQLQAARVIHKDIKPANILINPTTQQVKIFDFSIASLLPKETQEIENPNIIEGTLAYISPEQTGRMNRGIDYRSDFYSLGITFYQLLTGKLPFQAQDAMELVHCHIAQKPPTLQQLNPQIPNVLSDIVMKLMAKNAEDRYQSALGLQQDLENCLEQLKSTGEITTFAIAQHDLSDRFIIPEKLYGRQTEVIALLDAFERVAQGSTELMLVAGFSGIGKTAVVNEVHKPIVRQRGYFIKGKFDQFNRDIPFSAFVQAFRDLMGQLLSESDAQLQQWKAKIFHAVGENAQVIIDVIPELERIIGTQPPVIELSGSAAQNRFNLLFQKFVQVFTSIEHPLVIFLDDLQWADSASLQLLQLLMNDAGYLLILGAYRDNEVSPGHPFILTVNELEKIGAKVNTITLQPLSQVDINHLVADTVSCVGIAAALPRCAFVQPLTELVYQKAKGNPFFTTQFLKALHDDGLIKFNPNAGYWSCDITEIKKQSLTDDVVEFMAQQLQKLPSETQEVLKLAACIGAQFDLHTLAIVSEQLEVDTAAALWRALQEGLIVPLNETYKFFQEDIENQATGESIAVLYRFLHDRVQQAAYSLILEEQKQSTHLKIGQLLLNNTPTTEQEEKIFQIVSQLNMGLGLITQQTEKNKLAELNLIAGRKANASTAYAAAVQYLTLAIELLGADSWKNHYELTRMLYEEVAAAEYLNTNFEQAINLTDLLLQQTTQLLDKIKAYELKVQIYIAQDQQVKAIDIGLEALKQLEIPLRLFDGKEDHLAELPALANLANIQEMTKPESLAALRLLISITPAVHHVKPDMFPSVALTMIHLCLEQGNSSLAAYVYGIYGLFLSAVIGDVDSAYHSGQISLKLLEQYYTKELRSKIYMLFGVFVCACKEHGRNTLNFLREGMQYGLETGDIEYASYSMMAECANFFLIGEPLNAVEEKQSQYINLLLDLKQKHCLDYAKVWRQLTLNFLEINSEPDDLSGVNFDEAEMLSHFHNTHNHQSLFAVYVAKTVLSYTFGKYEQAAINVEKAQEYIDGAFGILLVVAHNFYYSLSLLADFNQQEDKLSKVAENQKLLGYWANYAPVNFQHKYELVEAETARVRGDIAKSIEHYDRAIALAQENKYLQEEALANELAAKFYLNWGKEKVAAVYMQSAYYCYSRWGAKTKVVDLEKSYSQLLAPILHQQNQQLQLDQSSLPNSLPSSFLNHTIQTNISSTSSISNLLDFSTILKASQAVSSEIKLEKLLSTLVKVVMENAGADKCALILLKGENLVIEATTVLGATTKSSVLQSIPIESSQDIPISIINYVSNTQETLVIDDAIAQISFASDAYIQKQQPKSLLCTPIIKQGKFIGILYLENHLNAGVFTRDRLQVINLLTAQAAISLENAKLYGKLAEYSYNLEQKVAERTQDLTEKATQLESTLKKLYSTQSQLIQNEKMSSLGQLVAGIAHEINNPVNFIYGNIAHANEYIKSLVELIDLYQKNYPQPQPEIEDRIADIDLEFIVSDVQKLLGSMQMGSDRIRQIVNSLRNFSRLDEAEIKPVDIHSGIDSTLLILQHRLKPSGEHQEIQLIKEYNQLPLVNCYASALNQVFMNILSNAIDALRQAQENHSDWKEKPTITIRTSVNDRKVVIRIADNGLGMEKSVSNKIFEPFFTTKPVGSGTGLGLSISYSIVVEKHQGNLSCISAPGKGAEFVIEIPV